VQPETKYAWLGRDRIAYQVLGQGPPDLVMTGASLGHLDIAWEDPGLALFLRSLASFSRLILFNRRGTGASDPLPPDPLPPWESYAEELAAVLDAVGSQRTAILAELDAAAIFFAGTRPQRTSTLILVHTSAKGVASQDYPIGVPPRPPRPSWPNSTSCGAPTPWPPCWCPAAPRMRGSAAGSRRHSGPASAPGPPSRTSAP
jgi:pimeloyl-ACP methyl ester carboxylesterase